MIRDVSGRDDLDGRVARPVSGSVPVALLLALVAGVGVLGINHSRLTPGVHGDSVEYLAAAEAFGADGTFSIPITHWSRADSAAELSHFPPGYSVVLSGAMRLGLAPQAAALWVTAFAAAVVAGGITLLVLPFGLVPSVLSVGAILSTPVFARLHLAIWSEPLFMAITVLLLLALVRRPRASWLHGIMAAAALAVRYVGVAGALAVVLMGGLRGRTPRERVSAMVQGGLPSVLFLLWWRLRVDSAGEMIRDFGFQGGLDRTRIQLAGLLAEWPMPGGVGGGTWLGIGALVFGTGLVWRVSREAAWREEARKGVLHGTAVYIGCYLAVVVLSRLFADPRIPFDPRIFFPVLMLATVLVTLAAVEVARTRGRAGWIVLGLIAGGWWLASVAEVRQGVRAVNEFGLYFTSVGWADDAVLRWVVDRSAPYATVYSNEPAMIYFLTGRNAKSLPREGEDVDAFAGQLARLPGPVVFIAPPHVDDLAPPLLVERAQLQRVVGSGRAVLFLPAGSPPTPGTPEERPQPFRRP
jgi:hypothetical protein